MFQKFIVVFLLVIGWCGSATWAQAPNFQQITDIDGLPSMTVYDVLQDQQGFLWFGTEVGICKYDGYTFKTYDIPSSFGKACSGLKLDQQGRIFFRNFTGQLFYIAQDKVFEVALPKTLKKGSSFDYLIDDQNKLWLAFDKLYCYQTTQKKWVSYPIVPNQSIDVHTFVKAFDGRFYLATNLGTYRQTSANNITFELIYAEHQQRLCATHQGVYVFHTAPPVILLFDHLSNTPKRIPINTIEPLSKSIVNIREDRENNTWVMTRSGAVCLDSKQRPLFNGLVFLRNKYVTSITQDREGNYWFTTLGDGVFFLANKNILTYDSSNSALLFDKINCLILDQNGQLIVGGNDNNVLVLDQQQKLAKVIKQRRTDIECMFLDTAANKLFVENYYLNVFDYSSQVQEQMLYGGSSPKDIAPFGKHSLVVAAGDGAYVLSKNKKPSELPLPKMPKSYSAFLLRKMRSRTTYVDQQRQRVWVGYADGLHYYEKGKSFELKAPNGQPIVALDLVVDAQNHLWIGTMQQGIFAVKDLKIVSHLQTSDGLISNYCKVIRPEGDKLWIGTEKGIQQWDVTSKKSKVISQEDGLVSNEIQDLLLQNNHVWVATSKGLTRFAKSFQRKTIAPPLVYITEVAVWEKAQKLKKKYDLAYDQNSLKIEFCGLNFRSVGKFRYKYRLKGLNDQWIYLPSNINFVRFPTLGSGKYTFELKVLDIDGVESTKTAQMLINIATPYWRKWWFIVAMTLLGVALVSTAFLFRIRAIQRKNALENDLRQANLQALKIQMNPHFIFNSLSSIQNYMLKGKQNDADRYLSKFAKLTRQILESSRQEFVSIDQEVQTLSNYLDLEKAYAEKDFSYEIKVSENIDAQNVAIPPLFAQPFIENAIKHGIAPLTKPGHIEVHFTFHQKLILLAINDNGVGRSKAQMLNSQIPNEGNRHQSLSTQISQERIQVFQQILDKTVHMEIKDILDTHNEIVGTCVQLFLPYKIIH